VHGLALPTHAVLVDVRGVVGVHDRIEIVEITAVVEADPELVVPVGTALEVATTEH
jgi:hypothetical protein